MNRPRHSLARFFGILAALLGLTIGLVTAPPANAAVSPATVTVNCSAPTISSSTFTGAVGESFTIVNSSGASGCQVTSISGVVSTNLTESAPGTYYVPSAAPQQGTFTIIASGTFTVTPQAGGGNPATMTVQLSAGVGTAGGPPTAAELPGAPTNLSLTGGNGLITASWSAPTSSGSGPISKYEVSASSAGNDPSVVCAVPVGQTSCAFSGSNGVLTTVTVKAYNDQGWGPGATGTVTPTTSATCTNLSVDVAQPSSGAVTSPLTETTSVITMPYLAVPYGGSVKAAAIGTYTPITNEGAMGGDYATFTPRLTGSCWIDVTIGEGAKLSLSTSS